MFSFLNPQGALGQLIILGFFVLIGVVGGWMLKEKMQKPCPPSTEINIDPKIKAKKNGSVNFGAAIPSNDIDCDEYIKTLTMSELRKIKK